MEKYGYRNISNRDEIKQNTEKLGKHIFSNNSGKHVTRYDFINWGDQSPCGLPGQTNYDVKSLENLLGASEIVSNTKK